MRIYNIQKWRARRRELRNTATPEEILLWEKLKNNQVGSIFRRQFGIGCYIADFYCPEKKLAIEVDGEYHSQTREYDRERDSFFNSCGVETMRIKNSEILDDIDEVIIKIKRILNK